MTTEEARIARVVEAYDAQGWHRTATDVDSESAKWLVDQLRIAGLDARTEDYPFERLVPTAAFIELGTTRIDGLQMFDAPPTPPEGVTGRLGEDIALVVGPPGGPFAPLAEARLSGAKAVLYVTTGQQPGLAPRNAEAFRHPFGPPVLQIASEHREVLEFARSANARVHITAVARRESTVASNVVATVLGSAPALPPIGVMTPRSGWWNCASERGGGIAAFLEVARAIAALRSFRTVEFVASTGHELGHWGLEEYLAARPGLAANASLWVHFGASVGAAITPQPRAFASSDDLEVALRARLATAAAPMPLFAPRGTEPGGESREIHRVRGNYLSVLGSSGVFHLEADRWPHAVSIPTIAAIARATAGLVTDFANAEPIATT